MKNELTDKEQRLRELAKEILINYGITGGADNHFATNAMIEFLNHNEVKQYHQPDNKAVDLKIIKKHWYINSLGKDQKDVIWNFFIHNLIQSPPKEISDDNHNFERYKKLLDVNCDEGCFYNCSQAGQIKPSCLKEISDGESDAKLKIQNLELYKTITFDELIKHGIENNANIVNGMPWSWKINGKSVTHEHDDHYIIETMEGTTHFFKGINTLIAFENGLKILQK